ncbi:PPE domain-containing protein [Haloactinomyces albus]|uniref:PPE domain-containing protein n=1 Tax=Haloactinomyces albus TaxID=1352928 RepID=A0AAE4CNE0_9ACTN|nr:PPE domain-containing protein [Haloactinomyces albus]MDR7300568.1 hypothetical protein [Haloactinomyces albus]
MGFLQWADNALGGVDEAIGSAVQEGVGDVRDVVVTSFGGDSMAENAAQEQAAAAQKEGQQQRRELAAENRSLQSGNGYDPPSISQHENWKSLSHRHIYDTNQRSLSESDANAIGTGWENIGKELGTIGDELAKEVPAAIQGGWEGQAAEAANRSVTPQAEWMRTSGEVFHLTGNKIKQAGSAAGQVKAAVPQPDDHDLSQSFVASVLGGPAGATMDATNQMRARQEAERNAQETMERVFTGTYAEVDRTVPAYQQMDGKEAPPQQPPPADVPPVPPTAGPGGSGAGSGSGGGFGAGSGGVSPAGYPGGSSSPGTPGYPGSGGGPGSPGYPGAPGGPEDPAGSGSAWAPEPTTPGDGAPGAAGSGTPGGAGAGRVAGGAAGGGAVTGGYAPAGGTGRAGGGMSPGGRAGSGAVGGGKGAAPAPSSSSASSSGRGAGRMPMGAMGGGRNQGGEDEEHERPGWLEEWDDVWFNDMPRTAPPVLGE